MKKLLYPLRKLHGRMYETKLEYKKIVNLVSEISKANKNTVLYVLIPTHGNLGDHAIASATIGMLNNLNVKYINITERELRLLIKYNKINCMDGYAIIVNGGGNIGTLWPGAEEIFRKIIKGCPNSKILCFPNTAYFENSNEGQQEFQRSTQIYNGHPALKICARERISYEILKKMHYDVVLIPDMVFALNKCKIEQKRQGCMLCLRKDIEQTRSYEEELIIRDQARQLFGNNIWDSDMNIDCTILAGQRESELEKKFQEFRSAELVITDRLHGMIFATITGTPCIVVNSKSHKVKGCYEWIQTLDYVKFVDNVNLIMDTYKEIGRKQYNYDNSNLQSYYETLKNYIIQLL